jgi:hypothetical protein
VAGRLLTLTAHMDAFAEDTTITITATPMGGSPRVIASGHPDPSGNLTVKVRPLRHTTYIADAPAGDTYGSAHSKQVLIEVRAAVTVALGGGYATTSDHYRLYHYSASCVTHGRGCPVVTATVFPNHAGKRVLVAIQIRVGRGWVTISNGRFTLGRRSRVQFIVHYTSRAIIGHSFRQLVKFLGDTDHLGASGYRKFRITN